ncbi:hypothetical protein QCA50_006997 [Cerrena zonata]|uniref:SET domain-containing protein n=1 Tax=Cerrena zonata TaxID=2478898 RepID=A0AAW0GMI0_9APHY
MSTTSKHRAPEHLNVAGCRIAYTEGKGRGVFASRSIPAQTVVEISPVLLLNKDEYESYGKHTVIAHYTFKWPDGRMALALGLGSLFNHSDRPNVSFNLDTVSESIRYTTSRAVPPDEELCIFYGHNLWFDPVGVNPADHAVEAELEDGWGGLSHIRDDTEGADTSPRWELVEGNPQDIISEDLLPFVRTKVTPDDPEEEEMHAVQTVEAWVVDIPEQRQIATMLKWLRTSGLGDDSASHLKRIRKKPIQQYQFPPFNSHLSFTRTTHSSRRYKFTSSLSRNGAEVTCSHSYFAETQVYPLANDLRPQKEK